MLESLLGSILGTGNAKNPGEKPEGEDNSLIKLIIIGVIILVVLRALKQKDEAAAEECPPPPLPY